jgi:hypothetical protein
MTLSARATTASDIIFALGGNQRTGNVPLSRPQ